MKDIEILDVIDNDNMVIGSAAKEEIYDKKLLHRIVHILVLHPKNPAIYFQKRAATKSFLPNYYCTSAGGHVRSGETHREAAVRELKEEIGITTPIEEVDTFIFTGDNSHQRLIKVFATKAGDEFSFTDGEVSEGIFFPISEAKKMIDKDEKIHPQLKACFNRLFEKNFFDFYYK